MVSVARTVGISSIYGLADQLIFPQGPVNYYQRVQSTMGAANTTTFARLFLAPGAVLCTSGAGPATR